MRLGSVLAGKASLLLSKRKAVICVVAVKSGLCRQLHLPMYAYCYLLPVCLPEWFLVPTAQSRKLGHYFHSCWCGSCQAFIKWLCYHSCFVPALLLFGLLVMQTGKCKATQLQNAYCVVQEVMGLGTELSSYRNYKLYLVQNVNCADLGRVIYSSKKIGRNMWKSKCRLRGKDKVLGMGLDTHRKQAESAAAYAAMQTLGFENYAGDSVGLTQTLSSGQSWESNTYQLSGQASNAPP